MEKLYWIVLDLLIIVYNIIWLVFLTNKHYGKVTTTAGHIFELNVLLSYTILTLSMILISSVGTMMSGILFTSAMYSWWLAIAGSQIETAIFLKTLNVNTMMTNTAGKIILGMTVFSVVMGVVSTAVLPSLNVDLNENLDCASFLNEKAYFYRMIIPSTTGIVIVFAVLSFAVFRSFQSNIGELFEETGNGIEGGQGEVLEDALFTINPVFSEENSETLSGPLEHDIIVEDIEFVNNQQDDIEAENIELDNNQQDDIVIERIETPPSFDQLSIRAMIHEFDQTQANQQIGIQCLPGISILQKLNNYLKNSFISLLILSIELPLNFTTLYGFITGSGCENKTLILMYEISYVYAFSFYFFLPYCIKNKLDRLSE